MHFTIPMRLTLKVCQTLICAAPDLAIDAWSWTLYAWQYQLDAIKHVHLQGRSTAFVDLAILYAERKVAAAQEATKYSIFSRKDNEIGSCQPHQNICIQTYASKHMHINICTKTYAHKHMHTKICTQIHAYKRMHQYICIKTYASKHMH